MRQIRPDPAGFGAGSYGVAYIIAGTTSTNNNTGTGYAVVLGQSGATDPIRLIHYNGGLQGTLTNLITSNTSGLADFGADYVSVQVNYTPSTNTWELFLRNDGVSSFADPVSGTLTSQGTVVNSTYTGTTLELMGGWWQGSTGATQSAFFDNVQVAVTTGGTNTSVQFASTGSTVNEAVGTVDLTLEITDEDATNDTEVDVVLITGAPGRVNSYTTQTVTFPGGSGADETVTITVTDNGLCDGSTVIGFELQNITGGQGTPFIGTNDTYDLSITDNDVCTGVSFDVTSATVSEGVGTYNVQVNISDFSASQATTADVVLSSGSAARINNYTTQTVTFPANSGTAQNLTITVTDNGSCDGSEELNFSLQNITGGQGTPFAGPNATRTLTVTDNDATTGVVIARQAFDGLGTDTWSITSGASFISTATGGLDTPASERILSGSSSWQVNDGNGVMELADLDVNGYSNLVLTARLSSTSTTAGNGAEITDIVQFYVDIDGAGFPVTPDVTVTGFNSNTRWGFSTGLGVASTTAGTPLTYTPAGAGNRTTDGYTYISIVIPGNPNTVALQIEALNNAAGEVWNIDDIQITGDYCATTYYSRADGNVGDAIWSDSPSGTAGSVTFDRFKSMVVQNGDVVNMNANTRVNTLTVDAGGQLDLAANTLTISGDAFDNNGTFTAATNSVVVLNSTDLTTVESASPLDLFDLTANTPGDVLTDATIAIRGTLSLQEGEFDASLGNVTLVSTAAGTARLGPVGAGASYTGTNFTVQRYIPAGATNWRFLGSPVAGRTIFHWKDDFYTAGFPGSHYPEFFDPPGSGIYWPSIRDYDETLANASPNVGLLGVEGLSTPLSSGKGFAAWSGDTDEGTVGFTIDLTGTPFLANTPITLPMTWTDSGNPLADGWNLVSNPVASPIDFTAISRGADVANQYYIFDPAIGNNRAWTNGVGSGGANGIIQSSQGFWLKATGSAVTTTVSEDDKVLAPTGGVFGGNDQPNMPMLRINLTNDQNSYGDESIVVFAQGTPALDAIDATKLVFAHPQAPQLTTRSTEGTDLAIDFYGAYTTAITIPVTVRATVAGTYTITTNLSGIGTLSCLTIEDLVIGTVTPLTDGASYSFTQAVTEAPVERFLIHGSAPIAFSAMDATCGGEDNGQATVEITGGTADVTWTDGFGTVLLQQTDVEPGTITFAGLAPGNYMVRVTSAEACGELVAEFAIEAPFVLEAAVEDLRSTSCPNTTDGLLDMLVLGGTAPFTYAWSNGADTEDLVAIAGDYSLTVTDANNCMWTSDLLTIEAGVGPVAGIEAASTTVVNTPVTFTSTTEVAETWSWSFGDGATSTDENPTHTYTLPGTYEVTLVVSYGDCSDATTINVTVELTTGIAAATTAQPVRAWMAESNLVVEHPYTGVVQVELMDATGRLHAQRSVNSGAARILVPSNTLSTGIWFVRVTNAGEQQTLRVPLVR
jgi:hypothetical protein